MHAEIKILGESLGQLDNQVEKWAGKEAQILSMLPQIQGSLQNLFPKDSAPIWIFSQAESTYSQLLSDLKPDEKIANGYLNLRFYIMLNGFLSACQESLEKAKHNPSLDPSTLVEKSYYTPYFFDRVTYTREQIIAILDQDLHCLENASPDQKGVLQALRIRKGTALTLTESYCPLYPQLYPLVAELEQIPVSKDPAVIQAIFASLTKLRLAL